VWTGEKLAVCVASVLVTLELREKQGRDATRHLASYSRGGMKMGQLRTRGDGGLRSTNGEEATGLTGRSGGAEKLLFDGVDEEAASSELRQTRGSQHAVFLFAER